MGSVWRDGKLVGFVGKGRNCRSGCVFPTGMIGESTCTGTKQEFKSGNDFDHYEDHNLFVGPDNRAYEERSGLLECLVAAKPVGEPSVYVDSVQWRSFPPIGELARLFKYFFSEYTDREVVMLVGKYRDTSGWLYYVPEQVGTAGSVKWTADDEEMDEFQKKAKWIGTIHSHPGDCCQPSQTDIDDWAEPEKSGLHVVFGRDGSFTVNGAIAERTFEVSKGSVALVTLSGPVSYRRSKNRTLDNLLKKPKPVVTRTVSRGRINVVEASKRPWRNAWQKLQELRKRQGPYPVKTLWDPETGLPIWQDDDDGQGDFVEETLDTIGALPLLGEDNGVPVLRIVSHKGQLHALTLHQYAELVEWCKDECPVPKSKRLRLYNARGGK